MFGWTEQGAVFSGVTLCDGMRYICAKNMTYIPNEGVDMHVDADPEAFSSSSCNTMDIIITRDFEFLWRPLLHTQIIISLHSAAKTRTDRRPSRRFV